MKPQAPAWLEKLATFFNANGQQLFLVGGAIRDQLLNRSVGEWDLATDAKPREIERLLRQFKANHIGLIGAQFGTVTAKINKQVVEITTFRSDQYHHDRRQPEVKFGQTLAEDLSRRDFTVNAIAYDLLGRKLIDPFNGQQDLSQQLIKAVGEPEDRFSEDPLRMLRAIRLAVQLGFTIDQPTLHGIEAVKDRFAILSAERIAQEMNKLLLADRPSQGIKLLVETGLINFILPELIPAIDLEFDPADHKDIYQHILQVLDQTPPKLALRWCALLHDIAKPITRKKIGGEWHFLGHENVGGKMAREILNRLKYPKDFINYQVKLVRLHQRIPGYDGQWEDGGVRRFVRDAGDSLDDLFAFAEADTTGKNQRKLERYRQHRDQLRQRITKLEKQAEIAKIKAPLDGVELMKLFNRPAGPWIKPIKEHLLSMVLDGQLAPNDKAEAANIARQFINNQ